MADFNLRRCSTNSFQALHVRLSSPLVPPLPIMNTEGSEPWSGHSKLSVESGQASLGGSPLAANEHNIDTLGNIVTNTNLHAIRSGSDLHKYLSILTYINFKNVFTIPFVRESVESLTARLTSLLFPAAFMQTEGTVPIRKARYHRLPEMKMIVCPL